MTDNEIIKALECCNGWDGRCLNCPLNREGTNCKEKLKSYTLDLTNRQKAEIEKWKRDANLTNFVIGENIQWHIDKAKSEARKEFAAKLTDRICESIERSLDNPDGDNYYITDVYKDIYNLVKEIDGE